MPTKQVQELPAWEKTLLEAATVSKKARMYKAAPAMAEALKRGRDWLILFGEHHKGALKDLEAIEAALKLAGLE